MEQLRYFPNPFEDFDGQEIKIDENHIRRLIKTYVQQILQNTTQSDSRGDLYVGDAGIAFMFLRLWQSGELLSETSAIENAHRYISSAKRNAKQHSHSRDERCAFLCGNAGIYAVSAVISKMANQADVLQEDLRNFEAGFEACKPVHFNKRGGDEVLVGRAGYLSGVYWLNKNMNPPPIADRQILEICESIVASGREYSKAKRSSFPLMYQYHSTEYLGAAHGVCAILHMLLESPWFDSRSNGRDFENIPKGHLADIKNTIDAFLALQEEDGNFPVALGSEKKRNDAKRLVHWCHGAPGVIYLLAKSYLIFKEEKYLAACEQAANLIWVKGLLYKGPGICHGVAGNGYAFLILFRLTNNEKYLYRAIKFVEFLTNTEFLEESRAPDRPCSLYEGLAGTVCFLVDVLHTQNASFPFMDVFH